MAEPHAPRSAPAPQSAAAHPMPAVNAAPKPVADQGAAAMPAQPVARNEDVMIRATPPKPSLFAEPPRPAPAETSMPKVFIPPQPERPASRAPRMPTFEELPVPGQNEFRARRGELPEADHPEKRRLTLLQRLAAVGLGRREDEPDSEQKPEGRSPEPAKRQISERQMSERQVSERQMSERQMSERPASERQQASERPPLRSPQRTVEPRGSDQVSDFAKRGGPQGLDLHGRATPMHHSGDDDQLDIPAFLRRQAT
jgi:cell division protein FtsZ